MSNSVEFICVGCKNYRYVSGKVICTEDLDELECAERGKDEYRNQNKRKKLTGEE
jgi:hypothetical protein